MNKGKVPYYSPDLKVKIIKEHFLEKKTYPQLSKEYKVPAKRIEKWVKKYRDAGNRFDCFFKGEYKHTTIISKSSNVPPVLYEQAGIDLDKISQICKDYPEIAQTVVDLKDLLVEKELKIKTLEEKIENVKKNLKQNS
ncbi:MAG: helix-turn-helix domain-containing protein [Thermotogota bacterium]|nr:helix-turn-helix domain-containing protein [Thermotogota bacterium]